MPDDDVRDVILGAVEASLDAQLRAVRRLRAGGTAAKASRSRAKGRSQVDMAFDILKKARGPLHVSEILTRLQATFGVTVDRESLVSSLTKKVARGDRFIRTEKNTFSLRPEAR
jgi:predicted transcriptional regulator